MKYFADQYDADEEWRRKLAELARGEIEESKIPGVIVRLGKPLKTERITAAKEIVLGLAKHPHHLVRWEVVWFCRWGKLTATIPLLTDLLTTEQDEDVREHIENTISYLSAQVKRKAL